MKGVIKENLFVMLMPSHCHRVTFGHIRQLMLGNYLQQTTSADDIFRCIFFLGALSCVPRAMNRFSNCGGLSRMGSMCSRADFTFVSG